MCVCVYIYAEHFKFAMYSLPSYYFYGFSEIQQIIRDSEHLTANRDAHTDTNTQTHKHKHINRVFANTQE
jgi:hypothetical protein